MDILDVKSQPLMDNSIIKREYHSYTPVTSSFGYNDEIRICQNFQDVFTYPASSYLHIEVALDESTDLETVTLANNFAAYLFEEARCELYGVPICEARNLGFLPSVKNLCSLTLAEHLGGLVFGWSLEGKKLKKGENLDICLPLKYLLNIFAVFQKILINGKLELILNRAKSDDNCYINTVAEDAAKKAKINIKKISWMMELIYLADVEKIRLLKSVERGENFPISYRFWDFYSAPLMSQTMTQSISLKTSTSLEKPRFIIVFFQTDRRDNAKKYNTHNDHVKIRNVRLFLNDQIPYLNSDYNFDSTASQKNALLFWNYMEFRKAYMENDEQISFFDA